MSLEQRTRALILPNGEYKPTIKDRVVDIWEKATDVLYMHSAASTLEEHLELSYKQRHACYFWYKTPLFSLSSGDQKKIDNHFKQKYPIQYFIRNRVLARFTYRRVSYFFYEYFTCKISPKQKWLMDGIPNTWSDKVWLIPHINFKMVKHFVEQEKCFDYTDYEASSEVHAKFAKELKECYDYIKNIRPSLEKQMDDAYPSDEMQDLAYEEKYKEVNRIEKEIEDNDTKWLCWIVTNRGFFWT